MSSLGRRVGVVLSGCGVHDGTEIHEAVLALLALDRAGARIIPTAPNIPQKQVINHHTGETSAFETRSVLVESARLVRGPVLAMTEVHAQDLDALVIPGGFGATKNLSDYALRGRSMTVEPGVAKLLIDMHSARKPIALMCSASVLGAKVLGTKNPLITVGNDTAVVSDVQAWGARHQSCDARGIVVDRENKLVTTPAYLTARSISEVAEGIDRAVRAMLELI